MIYINTDNRRKRKKLLLATVLVVAVIAIDFLSQGAIRKPARNVATSLWGIVRGIENSVAGSGVLSTRSHLARENQSQREQISALSQEVAMTRMLQDENEELRALLHLASVNPGVAAPVLSLQSSLYGTFVIGAGEGEGVYKGALVVSKAGFVIGHVSETSAHQSLVSDIFAPQASIEVVIAGTPLTLEGRGGGNAVGTVPRGTQIETGTPVLAPSLGQRAVGFVGKTEGDASSPSIKVYVRTPMNTSELSFVYVQ